MYSSVSSGTNHIFPTPRLEVVAEKQNPNGLAPNSWNQPLLHGMFRHQTNRPPGVSLGRADANHCDDPLLPAVLQQSCGSPGSRSRRIRICGTKSSALLWSFLVMGGCGSLPN